MEMASFLEKKAENLYLLHTTVKPNAKRQSIVIDEENLIISLRSKPIQNKANKELISLLKKKLKLSTNQIELISGMKGTSKTIKCIFSNPIDEQSIIKSLITE